jgi:hypothetical protein
LSLRKRREPHGDPFFFIGFEELWRSALPTLAVSCVKEGRAEGVFPPREQERVFGRNLPLALRGEPLSDGALDWLTAAQAERVRGLAAEILQRGSERLTFEQRRLCEAVELLCPTDARNKWHAPPIGAGGATLTLHPRRRNLWPFPPPALTLVDASQGRLAAVRDSWRAAVAAGWEWALVLEDSATYLHGSPLQLLALLPHLTEAASTADAEWQLLVLSLVDVRAFFDERDGRWSDGPIKALTGRQPTDTRGWDRIGPTRGAHGWVYRRGLMQQLLERLEVATVASLSDETIDAWVWDEMAHLGAMGHALAPSKPLVGQRTGAIA